MPEAGLNMVPPGPRSEIDKVSILSDAHGIFARYSFLPNIISNIAYEESGVEMCKDLHSLLRQHPNSTLRKMNISFGNDAPKKDVINQLETVLRNHKSNLKLTDFGARNVPNEQFPSLLRELNQSELLIIDLTPEENAMDFAKTLEELAHNFYLQIVFRSNVVPTEHLLYLKENLSKRIFKEVCVHYNQMEEEAALQTLFGESVNGPEDSLVWTTNHQNGNLKITKYSGQPDWDEYKFRLIIRPNEQITSISVELKSHQKVEMSVDMELIKASAIGCPRDGHIIDMDFRTILMKDLGSMLRNQKETIDTVNLDFASDRDLFKLLETNVLLGREPQNLGIRNLEMSVFNPENILSVLPHIDSQALKILHIKSNPLGHVQSAIDLRQVVELGQWKNVKELTLNSFVIQNKIQEMNLEDKSHIKIHVESLFLEDLCYLTERFHTEPHHKEFRIAYNTLNRVHETTKWNMDKNDLYFAIPEDQVLRVSRHNQVFTFSRISTNEVPMGVVPQRWAGYTKPFIRTLF